MRGNGGTPTSARLRRSEFPAHCRRRAQTGRNSRGHPEFSPAQRAARGIQSGRFSKHAPNIGGGGPARCDFGRVGRSPLSISPYFKVPQKNPDVGTGRSEVFHAQGARKGAVQWAHHLHSSCAWVFLGILGHSWPRESRRDETRGAKNTQEYPRIRLKWLRAQTCHEIGLQQTLPPGKMIKGFYFTWTPPDPPGGGTAVASGGRRGVVKAVPNTTGAR